jgi:hypothetical protein
MSIRTRCLSLLALALLATPVHAQENDDKAQIRERFRLGMEKYQQGAYREAIGYWDGIYREMGPRDGYRLSFNLARAYEKFQDYTLAAERYEAFLTEVELRRQESKPIEPIVEKEEKEATERLEELRAKKGRLKVTAGRQPVEVKIDETDRRPAGFVAYVAPGAHMIVFLRGSEAVDKREVPVKAGEIVEIEPPAAPEPPPPERIATVHEIAHPFTPVVLWVAGGVALASVVVPVVLYANALSIKKDRDGMLDANGQAPSTRIGDVRAKEDDYLQARTTAYATIAIPLSLATATAGLTAWYFLGTKEREIVVRPTPTQGGLGVTAVGRF